MRPVVTAAVLALAGLPFVPVPALSTGRASQQQKQNRREFMRRKLEFSKNVLEGLALEQYPTIEKNAKAMKVLSQAAEWEVPMIPNAADYVALTSEFQRHPTISSRLPNRATSTERPWPT